MFGLEVFLLYSKNSARKLAVKLLAGMDFVWTMEMDWFCCFLALAYVSLKSCDTAPV